MARNAAIVHGSLRLWLLLLRRLRIEVRSRCLRLRLMLALLILRRPLFARRWGEGSSRLRLPWLQCMQLLHGPVVVSNEKVAVQRCSCQSILVDRAKVRPHLQTHLAAQTEGLLSLCVRAVI